MYRSIMNTLTQWNDTTSERQKLQHSYVTLAIALIVVAGVIGLVNYHLSQLLLSVTFGVIVLFLANVITWALIQSLIIIPLEGKKSVSPRRTSTKNRSTRR